MGLMFSIPQIITGVTLCLQKGNTETSLKAQALVSDRFALPLKVFTWHLSSASSPALVSGNTTVNTANMISPPIELS